MAPTSSPPVDNAPMNNTSKPSTSSDTITNTVFGLCAVIIGVLTVWQGHRLWKLRHKSTQDSQNLHHDQGHHLAELDASTASQEDYESLASADDTPTRTPFSGQSSWSARPSIDSSTARDDISLDRTHNLADLAQVQTDPIPYNDLQIAHNTDQHPSPPRMATQSSRVEPSAHRYSAPGTMA